MVIDEFITKWMGSGASERSNSQSFLNELCDVLGVPRPNPSTGDPAKNTYVFERDVRLVNENASIGRIDLYKQECFILEAKQGSTRASKKRGSANREHAQWNITMRDAFGQALGYARSLETPPPFIIVCDIGYCFDVYACFDRTGAYRPFPDAQRSRLFLRNLKDHLELLRNVFQEPQNLDPSKHSIRVTKEIASDLAELAKTLEKDNASEKVAKFLMRCIFTMFAEDTDLLPANIFAESLEKYWLKKPESFARGIEDLWEKMNTGGKLFTGDTIKQFNGGLFKEPTSLTLDKTALERLYKAAKHKWADVDPSIFGTLLERALDPNERHKLGAHFTPRAFVERLLKPTIEDPLREDWQKVEEDIKGLINKENCSEKDLTAAKKLLSEFLQKLCRVKVLDPACGTGNFLYVAFDLFKRLENEVREYSRNLGDLQDPLELETLQVTPEQFLGIEIKPWAKEIAELMLWLGFLQNKQRQGTLASLQEPVLREYKNIECRDALLKSKEKIPSLDEYGNKLSIWDGCTKKTDELTGREVPDESARIPLYQYLNPEKADWPIADFIIGNPPFLGNKRMRKALGDGYVDALRQAYPEIPATVDLVMYWWQRAAQSVVLGQTRRFGFISTNSIVQSLNQPVVEEALNNSSLVFAIADHPWVDSSDGAQVRISMTVLAQGQRGGVLAKVIDERSSQESVPPLSLNEGRVHANLRVGVDLSSAKPLKANQALSFMGVILSGQGFVVEPDDPLVQEEPGALKHYLVGNELNKSPKHRYAIDFFGLSAEQARERFPKAYQRVLTTVKPERDHNKMDRRREKWWLHGSEASEMRVALKGLPRFIAICRTAKHFVFQFVASDVLLESTGVAIAVSDAFILGCLSSRIHIVWARIAGTRLGIGNDLRYNNSLCFETFPFPETSKEHSLHIEKLGEAIDTHRKTRLKAEPSLTITNIYNVLEKLRRKEALNTKEKEVHEKGLVSVLNELHQELDSAVFDAYGWPGDLNEEQILEKLLAFNHERATKEAQGEILWLRPEHQKKLFLSAPIQQYFIDLPNTQSSPSIADSSAPSSLAPLPTTSQPWPSDIRAQISAVRNLFVHYAGSWNLNMLLSIFEKASASELESVLDIFVNTGRVVTYEKQNERRWKLAGL